MKYVALLRGINVGGNSIIRMSDLKLVVEQAGFTDVSTFIQSGNVIFDSGITARSRIRQILEEALLKRFGQEIRVVVRSLPEFRAVVTHVPAEWNRSGNLRCYLAFVREPVTPADVLKEISVNAAVDAVSEGPGVLYMSTKLSGLTKSGFTKLVGTKVYKDITIRNISTVRKILALMEKE